jgi:hypothetical protein
LGSISDEDSQELKASKGKVFELIQKWLQIEDNNNDLTFLRDKRKKSLF